MGASVGASVRLHVFGWTCPRRGEPLAHTVTAIGARSEGLDKRQGGNMGSGSVLVSLITQLLNSQVEVSLRVSHQDLYISCKWRNSQTGVSVYK